ncbi:MAG TPA: dihydroneopterin aldolase [Polyangiaceae bacterium LLY-WYZ-15_(1-7)]|nr:dihydroneopterin aldolase [Polyangiaceae bacterium LLY-WYZ-15_(1-7)]
MNRDIVRIESLHVDCVVGLYPHERNASQPLKVDLELVLDTERAARKESVFETADYAATASQVVFLLRSGRFRLLETAAHAIATLVLAPPAPGERGAQVVEVAVSLTKPGALKGFATPSLTIRRAASWCEIGHEDKPWGSVDVLYETRDAGIYRLNIAPGEGIPLHVHRQMRESEMVLTRGLLCQGSEVPPGTVHRWPRGAAHRYDNPSERWQSILCVDLPRFIPEDEIEVEGEPADVAPEPPWGPIVGAG